MADYGAEYTDKKIEELEKRITSIYREASDDIERKMADFNDRYRVKEAKYAKQVADGKITQDDFDDWKRRQVFQGKQWQAKKQQIENTLYNANSVAVKMVNGETNSIFAANVNFMSYSLESGAGVNFGFGLYDESTVVNLIKNEPDLLPKPRIKKPKDEAWNSKKITRQITQGIIQGESLDDIATRLADTTSSQNRDAMLTHARTAMTGAQNAGRQYQLGKAQDLGIKLKKEWMATLDHHTRINHRLLDGQKVNTDDDFEVNGLKIRYPGDPQAVPAMTYNCRCTMVGDIEDYPATYNRYDNIDGKPIKNMTYIEWEAAKSKGEDISPVPLTYTKWEAAKKKSKSSANTIINGKDISATWKRRPDQFDFEIEDVINAQGFDGKPRVVSAEEFDEAVKVANNGNGFIAQRTYSAPDQETLDAYRDQLYNGKWYVDCSTGGAQYGQGMYCAADYAGELSDGIKMEMKHYKDLGESRYETYFDAGEARQRKFAMAEKEGNAIIANGGTNEEARKKYESILNIPDREWAEKYAPELLPTKGVSYTETLTLDPSAKIINFDMVRPEYLLRQAKDLYSDEKNSKLTKLLEKLDTEVHSGKPIYGTVQKIVKNTGSNELEKIFDEYVAVPAFGKPKHDAGSIATMLGYDAINAGGHGQSGSYTVILNRTKLIIKGE